jgi:DHA2 family multidrug resistance protein
MNSNLARPASFRTWVGFSMMCLGMLMPIPDTRVVATSLPTIQRAWNIAPDEMSWIRAFAMTLGTLSVGKDPQCDD